MKILLTVIVCVTALFVPTSSANAETFDDSYRDTSKIVDTLYTTSGVKVSTKTTNVTKLKGRDETGINTKTFTPGGTPSPHGCRGVVLHMQRDSVIFGSTIYLMHYQLYWCWYLTQVYNVKIRWYLHEVDDANGFNGLVAHYNHKYTFRGIYGAGYKTYRMWEFQQCLGLIVSLCNYHHPWAKIWAHGDGTFSWDREGG